MGSPTKLEINLKQDSSFLVTRTSKVTDPDFDLIRSHNIFDNEERACQLYADQESIMWLYLHAIAL
ncbi:hypothetical protein NQ318_020290 [Aromia moschata]|uniref:Uncharacterized protein n=1 Tax=Aromia moschata TaxID=1265417 RepID=A0AAV8ZA75_9CUCU|nr:hypothetical protein NQ318_020290 [Aromia moschata]